MNIQVNLSPQVRQNLSSTLRQSLFVLKMSQGELAQWIRQEVEKNPLLEEISSPSPPFEGPLPQKSLHSHLLDQIEELSLEGEAKETSLEFLNSLDERGFLEENLISEKDLTLLKSLQMLHPPGVFARNLKECWLLQIQRMGLKDSPIFLFIRDDFENLLQKRFTKLKKKWGEKSLQSFLRITTKLSCRPASLYQEELLSLPRADIRFFQEGKTWFVEVAEEMLPIIQENTNYLHLCLQKEERQTVREWHLSAGSLFRALKKRKLFLLKVGAYILQKQLPFFEEEGALNPLSFQEMALDLSVHTSTISRALDGKYGSTPMGLYPLKMFFPSGNSEDLIKQLQKWVLSEPKPLTDQVITERFEKMGVKISRRTIAKYRKRLKIASSRSRRYTHL